MRRLSFLVCLVFFLSLIGGAAFAGDDITVTVDGEKVEFEDVEPFIDERDRTQVPVRFVGEELGADVSWDDETETVTVEDGDRTVQFFVGDTEYIVNGEEREMDTTARIVPPGRVVIPARFVADAMLMDIEWFQEERTVALEAVDVGEPMANLEVEKTPFSEDDVIEFKIKNTGDTPITFEREFTIGCMVAMEGDLDFYDNDWKRINEAVERDGVWYIDSKIRKVNKSIFTNAIGILLAEEEGIARENIEDDWLFGYGRQGLEEENGETLPLERLKELGVIIIAGIQEDISTSWAEVGLDRIWPEEPTTLDPGETETQSFIPATDFVDEPRSATYRVAQEFTCAETGEEFTVNDIFYLRIDTDFNADLEMKDEEFTPAEEVEFQVENTGITDIEFARPFGVARYEEGEWEEVELDMEFLDDIVTLNPGETFQQGFVPEEDFANPDDVVEGRYIVAKLVRCSDTNASRVIRDEFKLSVVEEEAYFVPRIDSPDGIAAGEDFEVTFSVKNAGEMEGTQKVRGRETFDEEYDDIQWEEEVTLKPGEEWQRTESYGGESAVYEFELITEDESVEDDVKVIAEKDMDARLVLEDHTFYPSDEVSFQVENTGGTELTLNHYFNLFQYVDGNWEEVELDLPVLDVMEFLDPGEAFGQSFVPEEHFVEEVEQGTYMVVQEVECTATGEKMQVDNEFRIVMEEEAEFVTGIEAPEEVMVGDEFEVQIGVRNVGETEGTQEVTVTMRANGEEETWTDTMTLEPGDVRTEEESFIAGEDIEEYRFRSETEDDSASAVVEVIHYELH